MRAAAGLRPPRPRGRTSEEALRGVREELERLREDNRKVTSRLQKLEDKDAGKSEG
jgi:hypothetical protein